MNNPNHGHVKFIFLCLVKLNVFLMSTSTFMFFVTFVLLFFARFVFFCLLLFLFINVHPFFSSRFRFLALILVFLVQPGYTKKKRNKGFSTFSKYSLKNYFKFYTEVLKLWVTVFLAYERRYKKMSHAVCTSVNC